jgi:hypothetical protein
MKTDNMEAAGVNSTVGTLANGSSGVHRNRR